MLIRLQSVQIPNYWEQIKFSACKADQVKDEDISEYSVKLLLDLLNDKVQCVISNGKDRKIHRIYIIAIIMDSVTNDRTLVLKTVYGFVKSGPGTWKYETDQILEYARKMECKKISLTTYNNAVVKLANMYGMEETSKNFTMVL